MNRSKYQQANFILHISKYQYAATTR